MAFSIVLFAVPCSFCKWENWVRESKQFMQAQIWKIRFLQGLMFAATSPELVASNAPRLGFGLFSAHWWGHFGSMVGGRMLRIFVHYHSARHCIRYFIYIIITGSQSSYPIIQIYMGGTREKYNLLKNILLANKEVNFIWLFLVSAIW